MNDNKRSVADYVDLVHKIGSKTVTYTRKVLLNFDEKQKNKDEKTATTTASVR